MHVQFIAVSVMDLIPVNQSFDGDEYGTINLYIFILYRNVP